MALFCWHTTYKYIRGNSAYLDWLLNKAIIVENMYLKKSNFAYFCQARSQNLKNPLEQTFKNIVIGLRLVDVKSVGVTKLIIWFPQNEKVNMFWNLPTVFALTLTKFSCLHIRSLNMLNCLTWNTEKHVWHIVAWLRLYSM